MAKKPQKKQPSFKKEDRSLSIGVIAAIVGVVLALVVVCAVVLLQSGNHDDDPVYVQLDIKEFGTIVLELDPSAAPITVQNFTDLVSSGFYDGLSFHRIISGFMIQGGDPKGTGTGGSGKTIKGEFSSNGVENPISHTRGTISMARSNNPNSASSQFFIVHQDSTFLDGNYAAFGHVIRGIDVVDTIAAVETDSEDYPLESVIIERARVLPGAP